MAAEVRPRDGGDPPREIVRGGEIWGRGSGVSGVEWQGRSPRRRGWRPYLPRGEAGEVVGGNPPL